MGSIIFLKEKQEFLQCSTQIPSDAILATICFPRTTNVFFLAFVELEHLELHKVNCNEPQTRNLTKAHALESEIAEQFQ